MFVLLFVAVVVGAGLGAYYARRRRQDAFALFARQYGLTYSADDPFGLLGLPFALLRRGDGQGVENVLSGGWQGLPVHAFDYWYYEESSNSKGGRSKTYHRYCCVVAPIDAACSPLTIDEENVLTRLADMVALDDLQFESDEFNRVFNVKGADARFATAFIDARMMRWLLAHGRGYGVRGGRRPGARGVREDPPDRARPAARHRRHVPRPGPPGRVLAVSEVGVGSRRTRRGHVGPVLIAIVIVVAIIVIGGIVSYNRFVQQKNLIKDAWANIDTELRRRYDLIPNLVETVRGYATHEREVFENVTRARAAATGATGSPGEQAAAEGPLVAALRQLFAVVENYPDLKANQNFLALQSELSNTEDRLQTARRFYNANVREYNQRVQSFPSMIVARMFTFKEEEFFEVDEALRGDAGVPKVDFTGAAPGVSFGDGAPTPPASAPPATPPAASPPPSPPASGSGAPGSAPATGTPPPPSPPSTGEGPPPPPPGP